MASLPDSEKNLKIIFIRFGATPERDRQTDRRTPIDSIYRSYAYASRGKNHSDDGVPAEILPCMASKQNEKLSFAERLSDCVCR